MTPQRTARETKSIILNNVVIFNGKEESTVRGSVRIDGNRIRTVSTEPIGSDRDRPVEVIDGAGIYAVESRPVAATARFEALLRTVDGVQRATPYAVKSGIVRTRDAMEGVALKGLCDRLGDRLRQISWFP